LSAKTFETLGMSRTTFVRSEYEPDADKIASLLANLMARLCLRYFLPGCRVILIFSFVSLLAGSFLRPRMMKFLGANAPGARRIFSSRRPRQDADKTYRRPASYYGGNGYGNGWSITPIFWGKK